MTSSTSVCDITMRVTSPLTMFLVSCLLTSTCFNPSMSAQEDATRQDNTLPISRHGSCYDNRTARCNTSATRPDGIRWTLLDTLIGRYEVTFDLSKCDAELNQPECYQPDLYISEGTTEEDCGEMTPDNFTHIHSKYRKYRVIECDAGNCSGTPCNQRGTFSFESMFTACYWLVIEPHGEGSVQKIHDKPRYFKTDYVKRLIATDTNNKSAFYFINHQPFISEQRLVITTDMNTHPWQDLSSTATPIHYQLYNNVNNSSFTAAWILHTRAAGSNCSCTTQIKPKCEHDSNGYVTFTFSNMVDSGNYTLTVDVKDEDRCSGDTIWKPDGFVCKWSKTFEVNVTRSIDVTTVIESDRRTSLIILGVVLGLAVIFIATAFIAYRRLHAWPSTQRAVQVSTPLLEAAPTSRHTGVLLIYARDCQPFMTLMASFRRLLHQAGFEVIDCFDPHYWEAISCTPTEWIRHHLSHPRTKVIVVATRCASRRQRNVDTTRYRLPNAQDWVFAYALQALTKQFTQDSYSRRFVVRFDGFGTDADLVDGLNVNTRFVLPTHVDGFIRGIDPLFTNTITGSEELRELHESLQQLVAYTALNNNYLDGILEDIGLSSGELKI